MRELLKILWIAQTDINKIVSQSIAHINTNMNLNANKFENDLNTTIDNLIQDVCMASEEAHQAMQKSSEEYLETSTKSCNKQWIYTSI